MKSIKVLSTIIALACSVMVFGQGYTFKVLANKGTNQIKSGGSWQPLKTGATLNNTDEVKISENAYLGLMHSGGRTLEWKQAGTFKVSDLASKVSAGTSVAGKYADFLASKMSAEGQKNRLSATGAVHRALSDASINVHVPASVQIYQDNAILKWDALEGSNIVYKVVLTNIFEDVLVSEETKETFFELNMKDEKIKNESVVLLSVTTADDEKVKSETIAIKKLPAEDVKKVSSGLQELMTDVKDKTALNKYILAGFYEENNLLVDALTSYEEAIRLAPDVDYYKEAYEEFIIRNGFKANN
ncbi:MAG: hypothetical protein OEY51_06980 [Cyclobacteriaceae bacterium]|nr:hypothetical protein [Cyclobacteriaceae bacterium]